MSLRQYPALLAFVVLLLTTIPSPASVTVLPDATPTPRPKQEKPAKHPTRPEKAAAKPSRSAEKLDAKLMAGNWRGTVTGPLRMSAFSAQMDWEVQYTISADLKTVICRILDSHQTADGRREKTSFAQGKPKTLEARMEGEMLTAEIKLNNSRETWAFHLQSGTSLRVKHEFNGGSLYTDLEGVLQRQ